MTPNRLFVATLAAVALAPLPAAAADGAALFKASCVACHGAAGAGNPALKAPPLGGLDEDYALRQLRHFRAGTRGAEGPGAAMRAVLQTLPGDSELVALARHVATLKPVAARAEGGATPAQLNEGKGLFGICVACHGGQGEGNRTLQAPRLRQLPSWYVVAQLQAFRSGARGAQPGDQPGQQMRQIANEALPDDAAVQAVAAHVGALGTGRTRP